MPRACALQQEKSPQWEVHTATEQPQLTATSEKSMLSEEDPVQPEINFFKTEFFFQWNIFCTWKYNWHTMIINFGYLANIIYLENRVSLQPQKISNCHYLLLVIKQEPWRKKIRILETLDLPPLELDTLLNTLEDSSEETGDAINQCST